MKSFKKFVAEVAEPKSAEEKRFKDQHEIEVVNHPVADPAQHTGDIGASGLPRQKAKRKADQEGSADYDKAYLMKRNEAVENMDEGSIKGSGTDRKAVLKKAYRDGEQKTRDFYKNKLTKDPSTSDKGIKKAFAGGQNAGDGSPTAKGGARSKPQDSLKGSEHDQSDVRPTSKSFRSTHQGKMYNIRKAKKGKLPESAEELDELSKKTLGSYVKKSAADMSSKDSLDMHKGAMKRYKGIVKATDKLAKESVDESEMATKAALAKAGEASKDGKKKVTLKKAPWDKTEELSDKQKKIDHNKNGKIDGQDLAMLRKKKNEEVELDETTSSALKRPVTVTGPDGKTRTVMKKAKTDRTDDRGQDKIVTRESVELDEAHPEWHVTFKSNGHKPQKVKARNTAEAIKKASKRAQAAHPQPAQIAQHKDIKKVSESAEQIDEAVNFKKGPVKLRDGKQIMVSAQDAKLLNQMFKDLSTTNQRKMEKVAMMDRAGFEEILGFAREAL